MRKKVMDADEVIRAMRHAASLHRVKLRNLSNRELIAEVDTEYPEVAELVERLIAAKSEIEHLQGGVSCPVCGEEFEV